MQSFGVDDSKEYVWNSLNLRKGLGCEARQAWVQVIVRPPVNYMTSLHVIVFIAAVKMTIYTT